MFDNILITGLKRSGTTILWETFRRDKNNTCYDEPFHPRSWTGKFTNSKGTLKELEHSWKTHNPGSNSSLLPILPLEELERKSSLAQQNYIGKILGQNENIVVDIVRGWNRFPDLLSKSAPSLIVHLVRSPKT